MDIYLIKPTIKHKDQVMKLKQDFLKNNEKFSGCVGLENCETYEEWLDIDNRLKKAYGNTYSPSTVFLAIRKSDNVLIGIIDIRHILTDFLYKYGGTIGQSVSIKERNKGYGTKMLKLALEECKKLNINKVLLCCDVYNIPSKKTILKNGGVFDSEIIDDVSLTESGRIERYWLTLK